MSAFLFKCFEFLHKKLIVWVVCHLLVTCLDNLLLDLRLLSEQRLLDQLCLLDDLLGSENLLWSNCFDNHWLFTCNDLSWNWFNLLKHLFGLILYLWWSQSLNVLFLRNTVHINDVLCNLLGATHNLLSRWSPAKCHLLTKNLFLTIAPLRRSILRIELLDIIAFHICSSFDFIVWFC